MKDCRPICWTNLFQVNPTSTLDCCDRHHEIPGALRRAYDSACRLVKGVMRLKIARLQPQDFLPLSSHCHLHVGLGLPCGPVYLKLVYVR